MNSPLYKTSAACKVSGQLLKVRVALCFLTGSEWTVLRLEASLLRQLRLTVDFVVRPSGHWNGIIYPFYAVSQEESLLLWGEKRGE